MSTIEIRTFPLPGDRVVAVRSAAPADAAAHVDLLRDVDATTEFLVTEPGERDEDVGRRAERICRSRATPDSLLLVAEAGGALVGVLEFRAGERRRIAHVGSFDVAVRSGWRRRGVGTALVTPLLDWARGHPTIEKVALSVFATNDAALSLYRRLGFVEEGRRVREVRLAPGRYVDDVLMYRWVKDRP